MGQFVAATDANYSISITPIPVVSKQTTRPNPARGRIFSSNDLRPESFHVHFSPAVMSFALASGMTFPTAPLTAR